MDLYCASVYDPYEYKVKEPAKDKRLYRSAKPYNYYTQRRFCKPDGAWDGALYNKRDYNLRCLSSGAEKVLRVLFPKKESVYQSYRTPNDYQWMAMAKQGSYVFLDNDWSESIWFHSKIKEFNIITVIENRITQIVNLTRGSGKEDYNINSVTSLNISVGEELTRQIETWWGGTELNNIGY